MSLFMSVNVDIQAVFRRIGADMVMFVVAIFVYWIMCRVKAKAASAKSLSKEASLAAFQESPPKSSHDVIDVQCAPKTLAIESKAATIKHLPKHRAPEPPKQEPLDVSNQLALMQKYAAARNIKETLGTFRLIKKSGKSLTSPMYNAVMRAWIKCGNVWAAENWMEETKEAGFADECSFIILIKALVMVRDLEKARALLHDMGEVGLSPSIATFNELLIGFARGGHFSDGLSLLKDMDAAGVEPTSFTLTIIAKLMDSARRITWWGPGAIHQGWAGAQEILMKYELKFGGICQVPRLAAAVSRAEKTKSTACVHDVEIKGSLHRIKAVRRTLKQHGFLDRAQDEAWPLDGHWQTNTGLTVIIERKMVRWSQQHASMLHFTSQDRQNCSLVISGGRARGSLTEPLAPCATKALTWDNGDVWHSYDGHVIDQTEMHSQSMTKTLRDKVQDRSHRSQAAAVLKCVSKESLGMPPFLEAALMPYLGGDLYYLQVHFESSTIRADIFDVISQCHPRVGVRHCWVKPDSGSMGQRTLANGEAVDDACFNRHIDALCIA